MIPENTQHICRCGHERDQHQSRTEQRCGEKIQVEKCEDCPCEHYIDRAGPMSRLIDQFRMVEMRKGTR